VGTFSGMTVAPSTPELRRCALAVSVLHDLDLSPTATGVTLTRAPRVRVTWLECRRAIGGADPDSGTARLRLAQWLLARRWVADRPLADLAARVRPVGLPIDHVLHPGLDWVQERVLGDALDLGLGVAGLDPQRPDDVVVVPSGVLTAAGLPVDDWWLDARGYLEQMGRVAAERYTRNPSVALRPMGDCDVVTLLGSRAMRQALAWGAGGMRAVAVPMRTRGWTELSRVDPAYVVAAAAATDAEQRGFPRPLLVTDDEVALAPAGGRPHVVALADPAPPREALRAVLYR
jgi:hypothetical protein